MDWNTDNNIKRQDSLCWIENIKKKILHNLQNLVEGTNYMDRLRRKVRTELP